MNNYMKELDIVRLVEDFSGVSAGTKALRGIAHFYLRKFLDFINYSITFSGTGEQRGSGREKEADYDCTSLSCSNAAKASVC